MFPNCKELPDILAFSETWLTENKCAPDKEGFKFEHADSKTQEAGGVGVYISSELDYSIRNDLNLETKFVEDIWLDVTRRDKTKFVVGVIYRHPDHQFGTFCNNLCNTLDVLNKSKVNYLIVGDINIDVTKFNLVTNVTDYVNSLYSLGCNVCIDKPTRVTTTTSSCIDHLYSNLSPDRLDSHIIKSDVTDHYTTLTKIGDLSCEKENPEFFIAKVTCPIVNGNPSIQI